MFPFLLKGQTHMATRTAKIYFVLFLAFLLIAINTPVNFIYWMCAAMLSLLSASYALTLSLFGTFTCERENLITLFEGEDAAVSFTVHNNTHHPCIFIGIEDFLLPFKESRKKSVFCGFAIMLKRKSRITITYMFHGARRGVYKMGPVALTAGWPIGLFKMEKVIPCNTTCTVLPKALKLADFRLSGAGLRTYAGIESTAKAGSGVDIYGTREYRPGDSLSRIHWKSTAKKQMLIIKEFEGYAAPTPVLVLDVQRGTDTGGINDSTLETAIKICAALGEFYFLKRERFMFFASGQQKYFLAVEGSPADYLAFLQVLAELESNGNENFPDVALRELPQLQNESSPVLISSSQLFWKNSFNVFTELYKGGLHPCAMIIDAESYHEDFPDSRAASLFKSAHERLSIAGFQSHYFKKQDNIAEILMESAPRLK